jgi:hypothetical protein
MLKAPPYDDQNLYYCVSSMQLPYLDLFYSYSMNALLSKEDAHAERQAVAPVLQPID